MNEEAILRALGEFQRISLDELEAAELLKRKETKYTCKLEELPTMLRDIKADFRVLEVAEKRIMRYQTRYYDTDDYKTYFLHHGGRLDRFKIRTRIYLDSALSYFEIKKKNNHLHTSKWRMPAEEDQIISVEMNDFLAENTGENMSEYEPKLDVYYHRFTLVNKFTPLRLTFDFSLLYKQADQTCDFGDLVIVEVKKELRSGVTDIERQMKKSGFMKGSLSKYCLGLVSLQPKLKHNRFKLKFEKLYKPFLNEYTTSDK